MKRSNAGFTLIEIILAMSIFLTIIVVVTTGFIGISETYSRGTVRKGLSENAQALNQDVTKTIQSSGAAPIASTDPSGWKRLCVGGGKFYYVWNEAEDKSGLFRRSGPCPVSEPSPPPANQVVLVSPDFVVQDVQLDQVNPTLFHFSGLVRTKGLAAGAFNTAAGIPTSCVGSANKLSRNCALVKFDYYITIQG